MPEQAPADVTATPLPGGAGGSTGTADTTTTDQKTTPTDPSQQKPTKTDESTSSDPDSLEYWKHQSRLNEAKAKANADAAEKLAKLEDKDKTETQRLTDALAKAEGEKKQAETALLRAKVASEKGLPAGMGDRLQGETEAELGADADALLASIKSAGGGPAAADLKQGDRGGGTAGNDIETWLRKEAGRGRT